MNVLITNITSLRNKGCEALVKCIIQGVLAQYPESRFSLMSFTPEYDRLFLEAAFPNRVVCLRVPSLFTRRWANPAGRLIRRLYPIARRCRWFPKRAAWEEGLSTLEKADLVIASGGDVFSSDYGDTGDHLTLLEFALSRGRPVVLLAHSIGPFRRERELAHFLKVATAASLITVREPRSLAYVSKLLGRSERVHLTADVAFNLEPVSGDALERLRKIYRIPAHDRIIGFALSQGIAGFSGTNTNTHYEIMKQVALHYIREGYHLVLVPHVHERSVDNDDRLLVSLLARDLGYPSSVSAVTGDHTCEELKGIMGLCSTLVAERTHAAIGGMSMYVPTLNIAYSVKAYGITDALFGQEADHFRLNVREMTVDGLIQRIDWLLGNRDRVTALLREKLPAVRRDANRNFELIKTVTA